MVRSHAALIALALTALVASLPATAHALVLQSFDTARPVAPQHIEAGAGFSAGDALYALYAQGRIGLLAELEGSLAIGGIVYDEALGFEVDLGGKFRALSTADTNGIVDIAAGGHFAFVKTDDVFLFGADPEIMVSRHFALPGDRELFVGVILGAALTVVDIDGGGDDVDLGLVGALVAGVDIVEDVGFVLEGRWRDDLWRFGGMVTLDF